MNDDLKAKLQVVLTGILKQNAPVRDGKKYPGKRGLSPFPGNLRQNGIKTKDTPKGFVTEVGGVDAPYAPYTETRSRRKGWQQKSGTEFAQKIIALGGTLK